MPQVLRANTKQTKQCWRLNSQEWSDGLTTDQHLQREQAQVDTYSQCTQETESGVPRQINWILVPDTHTSRSDDDDEEEEEEEEDTIILAACETLYRPALLRTSSGTHIVPSYGIASVFVAPRYRGHGYAAQLLRSVNEEIRALGAGGSALWSDIGEAYYETLGWRPYPATQIVSSVPLTTTADSPSLVTGDGGTYVVESSLRETCAADCAHITRTFNDAVGTQAPGWSFLPTLDVMRWHYARMAYMATVYRLKPLQHLGYTYREGLMLWTVQAGKRELVVLRTRYTEVDTLRTLLRVAVHVARERGLDKVVVWDGKVHDFSATELSFVQEVRKGSLPALRVYGESSVKWINNEKFCWC